MMQQEDLFCCHNFDLLVINNNNNQWPLTLLFTVLSPQGEHQTLNPRSLITSEGIGICQINSLACFCTEEESSSFEVFGQEKVSFLSYRHNALNIAPIEVLQLRELSCTSFAIIVALEQSHPRLSPEDTAISSTTRNPQEITSSWSPFIIIFKPF